MEDKIVFNKGFAWSYEGDVLMNYEAFNDMMHEDIRQNNLTDPRLSYDYYLTEYDYHIMDSEPEYDEWGDHMVSETLIYAYKEAEKYYMSMNGMHYLGNFSGYMDGAYYISTEERRELEQTNRWLYEYIDDVVFGRNTKEERLKKEAEEKRQQELSSLGIRTQTEKDIQFTLSMIYLEVSLSDYCTVDVSIDIVDIVERVLKEVGYQTSRPEPKERIKTVPLTVKWGRETK